MSVRQLTFEDAAQAKRSGMARAWDNAGEWRIEALACIREWLLTLPDQSEVNADQWREVIPIEPPHYNALGALAGVLAKRGWIVWTGEYTTSKQKRGHCNAIRVWRVSHKNIREGQIA